MTELELAAEAPAVNRAVQDLGLSEEILLIGVRRGDTGEIILPRGDTVLQAHDVIYLITRPGREAEAKRLFEATPRPQPLPRARPALG